MGFSPRTQTKGERWVTLCHLAGNLGGKMIIYFNIKSLSVLTHTGNLLSGRETIMNLFPLPGVCSDVCGSRDGSHVDAMVSIRQLSAWPHTH